MVLPFKGCREETNSSQKGRRAMSLESQILTIEGFLNPKKQVLEQVKERHRIDSLAIPKLEKDINDLEARLVELKGKR